MNEPSWTEPLSVNPSDLYVVVDRDGREVAETFDHHFGRSPHVRRVHAAEIVRRCNALGPLVAAARAAILDGGLAIPVAGQLWEALKLAEGKP